MKTLFSTLLFCVSFFWTYAGQLLSNGDSTLLFDYSNVLSREEQIALNQKLQEYSATMDGNMVVILTKGNNRADSVALSASRTLSKSNLVIIAADVSKSSYGFFVSEGLKSTLPEWVIEKVENNHLKQSFKDKKYYEGLNKTTELLSGIVAGQIDKEELRIDKSHSTILLLIGAVIFFLLIFPVLQYFKMKRNNFTSKPMDVVSTVLLSNTYGTRGKNLFDDFSKGKGTFMENSPAPGVGGTGIEGMW